MGVLPSTLFNSIFKIKPDDFDLVNIHEPFVPGPSLVTLMKAKRVPVVATFHRSGVDMLYKIEATLLKYLLQNINFFVSVSASADETVGEVLNTKTNIAYNAVDVKSIRAFEMSSNIKRGLGPAAKPVAKRESMEKNTYNSDETSMSVKAVFVGRHEERKGLEVLLKAVVEGGKDLSKLNLCIVGEGPMTAELKQKYRSTSFSWLGKLTDEALYSMMCKSDILVAPSLYGESFGLILIEAMAAGLAIVASDLRSYREVLGDAGILFEVGNAESLNKALENVSKNSELLSEMKERARNKASEFDVEKLARWYLEKVSNLVPTE